ncbi:MAG TPA: right-handed parallel beta-helix repeat-containing protein [Planctomycetota bacterium]|nr:right-handed parallel beta-helix repeat-containing protein [Planctomycetota bacterium]
MRAILFLCCCSGGCSSGALESAAVFPAAQDVAPAAIAASAGWTSFTASADTRTVYVSASGNDQNDGLAPTRPKRTLAAGVSRLRHGFPDWLLLERGSAWHESLGAWKLSGRSASEPMLVSSFGDSEERPLLLTGTHGGIWTNGGGGTPASIDNLALVGLCFRADGYEGGGDCIGAQFLQPASRLLIEDCAFEGYSTNIVLQGRGGRHSDLRVRRCVIVDAYTIHATGGHSQGLYAFAVDGLLLEENLFDHNGWNESVAGAGADIFSHDIYIDNGNTKVAVRGNIIANASSHGMQLRPGGAVVDNLFLGNSIALSIGGGNHPEPGGVQAEVRENVIVDGKNIDEDNPRGWGIWLANIASGQVANNLIASNTRGTQPWAITLDGLHRGDETASIGIHGLAIEKNVVFDWGGGILVQGGAACFSDVDLVGNDLQESIGSRPLFVYDDPGSVASIRSKGNRLFSQIAPPTSWVRIGDKPSSPPASERASYADPRRSPAAYNKSKGGEESMSAFLRQVRAQSRAKWRDEFTAHAMNEYLRAGFEYGVR